MEWQIVNASLVEQDGVKVASGCRIQNELIQSVTSADENRSDVPTLNLHGLSVYPGLINSHDTLLASFDAFKGKAAPHLNWLSWDNEMKASPVFRERMMLEVEHLYQLGAYKNLISGVTTVVDHIPDYVRKPFVDILPVDLLDPYAILHSVCSYSLGWGDGIKKELEKSRSKNIPLITHIAEGFDPESKQSLVKLDEMDGLDVRTVLTHGLSLSGADIERISESGAHFVWCPVSNMNLYGTTAPIREILDAGINTCLGTDSAMTGSLGLLHELREAYRIYGELFSEELDPEILFRMVTENPARAFRMRDRGQIAPGFRADLLIMNQRPGINPYENLIHSGLSDVFLVVKDGLPVYGDPSLEPLFDEVGAPFESIQVEGIKRLITPGIQALLEEVQERLGISKSFPFLPLS